MYKLQHFIILWACIFSMPLLFSQNSCEELECYLNFDKTLPPCNQATGSISIQLPFNESSFQFQWANGQTGTTIIDLEAGWYDLTIFAPAIGCTLQKSISLPNKAAPELNLKVSEIRCPDGQEGKIEILPAGGQAPYNYFWEMGDSSNQINNLGEGLYKATVTDNAGCQNQIQYFLKAPGPKDLSYLIEGETCNGGDGAIFTGVTGPNAPYLTLWKHSGSNDSFQKNLSAGFYEFLVISSTGCIDTHTLHVPSFGQNFSLFETITPSNECGLLADGSAEVFASGFFGPYEYIWENGQTGPLISNQEPGFYQVSVYDDNNCVETRIITIPHQSSPFSLSASVTDAGCHNNSGTIMLTVNGSVGPYEYYWSTGDTTENLNNLSGGTYYCTVTDSGGCKDVIEVFVPNNEHLRINPFITKAGCDQENGAIILNASHGSQPYLFNWGNGYTGANPTDLSPGWHSLTLSDASGCNQYYTILVPEDTLFRIEPDYFVKDVSCHGLADGQIILSLPGGTAAYDFFWSTTAMTDQIMNLSAASYFVRLTNSSGCHFYDAVSVVEPDAIQVETCYMNPRCLGESNGIIGLQVNDKESLYQIDWSNGASGLNQTHLKSGTYDISITDANGCQESLSITLPEPEFLAIDVKSSPDSTNNAVGTATALVNGGNPPYMYQWNSDPPQSTQSAYNLTPGAYTIYVQDANGCMDSASIVVGKTSLEGDFNTQKAFVFPNPNTGHFYLKVPHSIQSARIGILDLHGRTLWSERLNISPFEATPIQPSGLRPGFYMLVLDWSGNTFYQKIQIQ